MKTAAAISSLVLFTASLSADWLHPVEIQRNPAKSNGQECFETYPQVEADKQEVCKVETCEVTCPKTVECKTTCCCAKPKPPCECVTRACNCGMEYFFTADFIYWEAKQDGLEFATTFPAAGQVNPPRGHTFRPEWEWEPGFKVGFGMEFCEMGWDLFIQYTWLHTDAHRSASTGPNLVLEDIFWKANDPAEDVVTVVQYDSASAKWRYHLNVIDLEFGRPIFIGEHIMLRPQMGLKGTWNENKYDLVFNFDNGNFAAEDTGVNRTSNNKIETWGLGLRGGMDGAWRFYRGVSLIGKLALTGLWEHFESKRFDRNQINQHSDVNNRETYRFVNTVLEWMLGIRVETSWCCDNYRFAIEAGWEEQIWFNQNRFIMTPGSMRYGRELIFQGLTAGVCFEF